jgi:hypothetical protein
MLKKFKKLSLIAATIMAFGGLLVPATVSAQLFDNSKNQACEALNQTNGQPVAGQASNACGTTNGERVNKVIQLVLNIMSLVVGIVAVVMVIISGLKYITSQGDSTSVSSAKNTLLYAVVGLIIVALAQFIVRFVLTRASVQPANQPTTSTPVQQL